MSDDEEQYDPKAHKSLLQAISSLGKVQHIRKTTRNEPKLQQDEFFLVKPTTTKSTAEELQVPIKRMPVGVNDLVKVLKTAKNHISTGKQLKNVQNTKKVLPKPLEKPEAARIKRSIGYENVKKKLARWDAVVAKNRSAETQVFPLPAETVYIDTSAHSKPLERSLKSKLAIEMEEAEEKLRQLKRQRDGDTTDEKAEAQREEAFLKKKLTRDELMARRRELAYLKMRESQKSARARLQNKIKSKKYHKLLKRQKMQEQIKEFELLQKTNPEAALDKLNELEKHRALERASLRHKNTGAWAKNLQVRAKYDKDVRKDLAEQLQISRQLTGKKLENESSDGEDAEMADEQTRATENAEFDPFNPWTKGSQTKSNDGPHGNADEPNWRKYWTTRNENDKMLAAYKQSLEESVDNNEDSEEVDDTADGAKQQTSTKAKLIKPKLKKKKKAKAKADAKVNGIKKAEVTLEDGWLVEEINTEASTKTNATTIDDIFDEQEDKERSQLEKKLQKIVKTGEKMRKLEKKRKEKLNKKQQQKKEKNELQNLEDLAIKNTKMRPTIDEELNYDNKEDNKTKSVDTSEIKIKTEKSVADAGKSATVPNSATTTPAGDIIDPTKLAAVKLKQNLAPYDLLNDDVGEEVALDEEAMDTHQQMTISQAFEDDDIVADFSKDKAKDSEVKNAEIVLSMPGWGEWAGAGISEDAKKRSNKRFVLKLATEEKRRDENKERVYINEGGSKELRTHLVSDVPFPFTSLADYEASIRAPIGRNFVTETAFRMLTRPSVITRKGQIIEPMDESELVKPERKLRHVVDKRIQQAAKLRKPL